MIRPQRGGNNHSEDAVCDKTVQQRTSQRRGHKSDEEIGSYFGSELCPLDLDGDGLTNYLLVGAPFFHVRGEEGKVYLYRLDRQTDQFDLAGHLSGHPGIAFARFGFAVASVGDVDQDGFGDVAVGAPLEEEESNPNAFGSVYIFNGKQDGIRRSFSQRITAAQTGPLGLVYFGRSVAGGLDFTGDGLLDIAVGSLGRMTLLRSRAVIRLEAAVDFTPSEITHYYNRSIITAKLCFQRKPPPSTRQPGTDHLVIYYTVDLDVEMERKRAQFEDGTDTVRGQVPYAVDLCPELKLTVLSCQEDCFSSIALRLSYRLQDPNGDPNDPSPVLDIYQESEVHFQLPFVDDCGNATTCAPHLSLTVQMEKELVVGSTKEVAMRIYLENRGHNSHMTTLVLQFPTNLHFIQVREVSPSLVDCDRSAPLSVSASALRCKIGHPVFKALAANFSVTWQLDGKKFPNSSANIILSVANANKNSPALREEVSLNVKYVLNATLSRVLPIVYVVSTGDRSSQNTDFTFNIQGKNPYGAKLELQIWVPVMLEGHPPLARVKDAAGTQNSTVCKAEDGFSEEPWADLGHDGDVQTVEGVKYRLVSCVVLLEREAVTVTTEMPLADALQFLKPRTDLVIRGELSFDRNLFVGLNAETHKTEIQVILLKEDAFDFFPVVVGSSVGGFILLLLITVALCKCGFFKRNYQNMRKHGEVPERCEAESDSEVE
ncbi:integrin alpha-E [Sceloporus undulatus]|uniref:integrin alpha-E n=1 Tax=Sceloporus undulatus TaxID=8520 RepID=UPI001C4AE992|nr:integrin alpha-E [Sceloporus undulatus]